MLMLVLSIQKGEKKRESANTTASSLLFEAPMAYRIGQYILPKTLLISRVLSVALGTCPLPTQQLTISGTVRNTGGVISNVAIEMTSLSGSMRDTTTDDACRYKFEGLARVLTASRKEARVGGQGTMVNVNRKKTQANRTTDCMYRGGRFDLNEVACGSAGKVFNLSRLPYRIGAGYSYLSGWRDAGWKRANVSPDLMWPINNRMRIAFNESLSNDHYDIDAGEPIAILDIPGFPLNHRFNPPDRGAPINIFATFR
jgi:hypothetical protein